MDSHESEKDNASGGPSPSSSSSEKQKRQKRDDSGDKSKNKIQGVEEKAIASMDIESFLDSAFFSAEEDVEGDYLKADAEAEDSGTEVEKNVLGPLPISKDAEVLRRDEEEEEEEDEEEDEEEMNLEELQAQIEKHQKELDALKETDPEFYATLQKDNQVQFTIDFSFLISADGCGIVGLVVHVGCIVRVILVKRFSDKKTNANVLHSLQFVQASVVRLLTLYCLVLWNRICFLSK